MEKLELQNASSYPSIPDRKQFQQWVNAALQNHSKKVEITIRIVDEQESAQLNETYRHKRGPTNVLSFPFKAPPPIKSALLGDLVICAPLVAKEAAAQKKTEIAHWAHLVVHGTLHLLGYDHSEEAEAVIMEKLEIEILNRLGFENPYER